MRAPPPLRPPPPSHTQVAPTILALLGISPNSLAGVRHEGTPVLPCLA